MSRVAATVAGAVVLAVGVVVNADAQESVERQAYFGVVADFFEMSEAEVSILGDWQLPADEIPVLIFIARRAGVSAEALAALRGSGTSMEDLAARYRVTPGDLHVPLPDSAPAGRLEAAYRRYRAAPPSDWSNIRLSDQDVTALVNVRILSSALNLSIEDVLRRAGPTESFASLYARLIR